MTKLTEEVFCNFLKEYWQKSPDHSVKLPKRCRMRANSADGSHFSVSSLKQCFEEYFWNSKNYEDNKEQLVSLRNRLRNAIEANDNSAAEQAFRDIYKWGRVQFYSRGEPNVSGVMLEKWRDTGELITKIQDSVDIVSSGKGIDRFDGSDLFMNSGYTKVVSLASPPEKPLIIFDGRVGAALGHIVTLTMQEGRFDEVEQQLLFPWGKARTTGVNRNPSNGMIKFPRLFRKNNSKNHAQAMYDASRIADKVAKELSVPPRKLEAALFMWGYAVPRG